MEHTVDDGRVGFFDTLGTATGKFHIRSRADRGSLRLRAGSGIILSVLDSVEARAENLASVQSWPSLASSPAPDGSR